MRRGPYKTKDNTLKTWAFYAINSGDNLLLAINSAVRPNIPESIRQDICQQVYVLLREHPRMDMGEAIRLSSKEFNTSSALSAHLSLDHPAPGRTEGTLLRDLIAGPRGLPKRGRKRNGRTILKRHCKECGQPFYRTKDSSVGKPGHSKTYSFCSKRCKQTRLMREKGLTKLPEATEIRRLYEVERLSCRQIGKIYDVTDRGVRHAMDAAGIKRRPAGSPPGGARICKHPGCDKPTYKIKHGTSSGYYGTFCFVHWKIENARRKRVCQRKKAGTPPERWRYQNEAREGQCR
jgi:endogenous inhibitor of DNA gyrase (YacG/DUF329 family)